MTDKFYLVPVEWFERAKVADSMGKINLVDELLNVNLAEYTGKAPVIGQFTADKGIIDWSKAPEGTTHCFSWADEKQEVVPKESSFWEKWEDGTIYDWRDGGWKQFVEISDIDLDGYPNRVKRP